MKRIYRWRGFGIFSLVLLAGCITQPEAEVPVVQQAELAEEEQLEESTKEPEKEVPLQEPITEQEEDNPPIIVPEVRGIYITGPIAGHEKMVEREQLAATSEINAMVIDIKNDEGIVTYKMEQPMVKELGAGTAYIRDLPELVRHLKEEQGLYLIARIVAFKDPLLAEKRPELCIKRKDGSVFRDKNGLAWVNPYKKGVWEYLMEVAKEAVAVGFDEIQFDYIRFPTEIPEVEADYGIEALEKSKKDVITEFTVYAYEQLSSLGVQVSADVFGTVIDNENDAALVGQDYRAMAMHLDYICPMVYPSHYRDGVYGIDHPDLQPYETIVAALNASEEILNTIPEGEHRAKVRPWLQDFTATWIRNHQSYGADQIRQEIQAVYDSGCKEWLLWNAKCAYTAEGLLSEE